MKNRIVLILSVMVLFTVCSCVKDNTDQYVGIYTGTLTTIDFVKEDVQLTFTNHSNKKTLSIFDIELEKISDNQFNANIEVILEIIHLVDTGITADILSNASATFAFENDEVTMDMKYNFFKSVEEPFYVRYIGKK